jgi:hypothetical protein
MKRATKHAGRNGAPSGTAAPVPTPAE